MSSPVGHALAALAVLEADRRTCDRGLHEGWRWAIFCAFLGCLPDIDHPLVRLFGSNVAFMNIADGWGPRRGLTHTLLFAATVSLLCAIVMRAAGSLSFKDIRRHAFLVFLCVASHLVLDFMTKSGNGMPFFWPIADERYRSPWPLMPHMDYSLRRAGWMAVLTHPRTYYTLATEIFAMGFLWLFFKIRSSIRWWALAASAATMAAFYIVKTWTAPG